ncbi:hypothetical protein VHUM_01749 [Vanrija humicola]|uniref:Shr3 amino acid permease chaperone n=1 Tax=Vanrija humicola TaxID=5417 RepID=A0A7D8YX94_VANHU|nr:hypothetical protein VHUM_01749 [Vanrija humicola]
MVWRTTIVTCTTCFLLGTTFTHWIADHNVLWRSPVTPAALEQSIRYYSLLGHGPDGLGWVYIAVGVAALVAAGGKLVSGWRGKGGEVLFDGASLLLVASITYNQVTELYPTLVSFPNPLPEKLTEHDTFPVLAAAVRDLANDNIITSVMLTGVMLLQAGRYYSSRTSSSSFPRSTETSVQSSPSSSPAASPIAEPVALSDRLATPFRELTESEALELEGSGSEVDSKPATRRPTRAARSSTRKK